MNTYHNYNNCCGQLEVQDSETTPYAFTLRKTKQPVQIEDYVIKLDKIRQLGCEITDHVFEHEAGLHCHGVIQIPKDFKKIQLRTRGWRLQLDELYDYAGWLAYITKSNMLEELDKSWLKQVEQEIIDKHHNDQVEVDLSLPPGFRIPKKKLFS